MTTAGHILTVSIAPWSTCRFARCSQTVANTPDIGALGGQSWKIALALT
jgi:hypothetical protein